MRYIAELERKVQTLQTEATSLSTQLTLLQVYYILYSHLTLILFETLVLYNLIISIILEQRLCCPLSMLILVFLCFLVIQRDTNGLNSENSELKLRLQTMEQQVHLQDGKVSLDSLLQPLLLLELSKHLSFFLNQHRQYPIYMAFALFLLFFLLKNKSVLSNKSSQIPVLGIYLFPPSPSMSPYLTLTVFKNALI